MKSSKSKYYLIAFPVLSFLVGIGLACAVYWLFLNPSKNNQLTDVVVSDTANIGEDQGLDGRPSQMVSNTTQASSSTLGTLSEIQRVKSPFERARVLRNLLAESDEEHVLSLLAESLKFPNHAGTHELQSAIVQRLAQFNPTRALSRAIDLEKRELYPTGQFVASVFREWARSNLDEAVANARLLDADYVRAASRAILQERMDLSEVDLRSIARTLGDEQMANALFLQLEIEKAIENPEQLWGPLIGKLQDDLGQWMNIARVANAWVEERGVSVLDQILPSITNSQTRVQVTREVLGTAAQTDPAKALEYGLTIEDDLHNLALLRVAEEWGRSDPQSALRAIAEIEQDTLRNSLEINVVSSWARADPYGVMESLSALPAKHHMWAAKSATMTIAWNSPTKAAQLVSELEPGQAKTQAAADVVMTWSRGDPRAALNWVLSEPSIKDIQTRLLTSLMTRLTPVDPRLAMTVALEQPIADGEAGMEWMVISALAQESTEKALEYLPQVREGKTRTTAYQSVGEAMVQNRDIDRAFELLKTIPDSEKTEVFQSMAATWARSDAEGLLNSMDRLETPELKSKAAMALVYSNRVWQPVLNAKQMERASGFLLEQDRQELEEDDSDGFQWW